MGPPFAPTYEFSVFSGILSDSSMPYGSLIFFSISGMQIELMVGTNFRTTEANSYGVYTTTLPDFTFRNTTFFMVLPILSKGPFFVMPFVVEPLKVLSR